VLGPLLFLIYINDIAASTSNLGFINFEDDTTVFSVGDDFDSLMEVQS